MTMWVSEKEATALERDAQRRAESAGVSEPQRKPQETRDDYHERIWLAIRSTFGG